MEIRKPFRRVVVAAGMDAETAAALPINIYPNPRLIPFDNLSEYRANEILD